MLRLGLNASKIASNCRNFTVSPNLVASSVVQRNLTTDLSSLPAKLREYVKEKAALCQPDRIQLCNGTEKENDTLLNLLYKEGAIRPIKKLDNCWLALTDPNDVARVESRTVISTANVLTTIPKPKDGFPEPPQNNIKNLKISALGNWMKPEDLEVI
jgi:phosphoenolpyruvate carboxykinase (GTP)